MLIRISFASDDFKLQLYRGDLQPTCKCANNTVLLVVGAEHEVDGLDLKDFYESAIGSFDDPVFKAFDRDIILNKVRLF